MGSAIGSLGKYHDEEVRNLLVGFLASESYRNTIAGAAIRAIRSLADPALIDALMKALLDRADVFPSRGFGEGLGALAYIARNEEEKTKVRKFITGYVESKKPRVQRAAIEALGILRDPKALSLVESFAGDDPSDRTQRSATQAAEALQKTLDTPVELRTLRQEVLELQKANKKLEKGLEDINKRLAAKDEGEPAKKTEETKRQKKKKSR